MNSLRSFSIYLLLIGFLSCQRSFHVPNKKPLLEDTHYSALVAGTVGTESPLAAIRFQGEGRVLKSIRVGTTGNPDFLIIQCLEFTFTESGTEQTVHLGRLEGATFSPPFIAPAASPLIGISGRGGWYVDAIKFHFANGSETELYGGAGGDTTYDLAITQDAEGGWKGAVWGLYGNADPFVETLGLIFEAIE